METLIHGGLTAARTAVKYCICIIHTIYIAPLTGLCISETLNPDNGKQSRANYSSSKAVILKLLHNVYGGMMKKKKKKSNP